MVKLYCNRCGKEIMEDCYYTVNVSKVELNSKCSVDTLINDLCSVTNKNLYEELKSVKMYCDECKDDIEELIANC